MSNVEVGQVYADKDPRHAGRTVEIMAIEGNLYPQWAFVRLNTVSRNVSKDAIGRRTRIRTDRFETDFELSDVKPHRTGRRKDSGELGYWPVDEIA